MATGIWTITNNMLTGRRSHGSYGYEQGAQGAIGGNALTSGEEWNGTSWSSAASSVLVSRYGISGAGSLVDAINCGGNSGGGVDDTEEYNGVNWSVASDMPQARYAHTAVGHSGSAIIVWGLDITTIAYNGTSWSNTGHNHTTDAWAAGSGTNGAAIHMGNSSDKDASYTYNGATWTSEANITQNHKMGSGAGSVDSAIVVGDESTNPTNCDEFTGTAWAVETVPNTTPIWQSANSDLGTHEAAIRFGGYSTGDTPSTEEWDDVPICWNYTARYRDSNRLFKLSGPGSFPKYLEVPGNVEKDTGKLIDDGVEIDPSEYTVE